MTHQGLSPETLAAQASGGRDSEPGALVPPIHPSTIYEANPDGTVHAGIGTVLVALGWVRLFPTLAQRDRIVPAPASLRAADGQTPA